MASAPSTLRPTRAERADPPRDQRRRCCISTAAVGSWDVPMAITRPWPARGSCAHLASPSSASSIGSYSPPPSTTRSRLTAGSRAEGEPGDELLPEYASASRREDLSGLPPAYVQVGDV